MLELYHLAFSAANIIPTFILLFVVAYWLLVILGALDVSSFDFDIDVDVDADIDTDIDATGVEVSWLNYVLRFFNISKLPLMVFVTFWSMPLWVMTVSVNNMFEITSFFFGLLTLIPLMFLALFIAKPITQPFVKLFEKLDDKGKTKQSLVGTFGKVIIKASLDRKGQVDILDNGEVYRLNIKTDKGEVQKGQQVLITEYIEETNTYIVEPYEV